MCIKMLVISQFIFLTVVMLTFQEIFSNLCESNKYSSPFANYHKLLGPSDTYDCWASRFGIGWNVARVNDSDERRFIEQAHLSAYDQRAYWIGGMSDRAPGTSHSPEFLSDSGAYHANAGTRFGLFTSFTIEGSARLPGILCEQEKEDKTTYTFSSATSYYQKLIDNGEQSFSDFSCMCGKVLGPGWTPAFLETFREIDFLREADRRFFNFANIQQYWIAGTVDLNNNRVNRPIHCNATASGDNPVIVAPTSGRFEEMEPSTLRTGILCEKAKI